MQRVNEKVCTSLCALVVKPARKVERNRNVQEIDLESAGEVGHFLTSLAAVETLL